MTTIAQMDRLAKKFEKNFSLVSCLSKTATKGVWFVDGGASHHMTGMREVFLSVSKIDSNMHVKAGTTHEYYTYSERGCNNVIPIRIRMASGGGRGIICPKAEDKLVLSLRSRG